MNAPADNNLAEFVFRLASLGRSDVFAGRQHDGAYRPERRAMTMQDAAEHVANRATFGVYLMNGETTRLAVLDFDDHAGVLEFEKLADVARRVTDELTAADMRTLLFRSGGGRGIHIWLMFANPQNAADVRAFLKRIVGRCGLADGTKGVEVSQVEIFPKQDRVEPGGFGSLVALPLSRASSVILPHTMSVLGRSDVNLSAWQGFLNEDVPCAETAAATGRARMRCVALTDTLEEAREALKHVKADDYDVWIRVMLALKAEFGDEGFSAFHEWSQAGGDKYKGETNCRLFWDRAKPSGALTVGTIFHLAQKGGWNGPAKDPYGAMNERFGILTKNNRTTIILKNGDRRQDDDFAWLGVRPFLDRMAPEKIAIPGDSGTTLAPIAPLWMKHPRATHYHDLDFDPSKSPGHNGNTWNLWQGFRYEPIQGSWDRLKEHFFENISCGRDKVFDWIMNWMALGIQRPAELIGTALVMRGAPGTGKSFLADRYGALWGSAHYVTITHGSQVTGRFNAHLIGRRLVFVDEGIFGGNRKEAGVIKTRITENYVMLEQKGVDAIKMRNRALYIVASNEDSIVPADVGERRWMVVEVGDRRKEDREYFGAIMEEMTSGGYEAMMYELLHRDPSRRPSPRKIIRNEALFDQMLRAQPAYVQYLHHILDEARLPQNRVAGPRCTTIRAMIEHLWRLHPSERHLTAIGLGRKLSKIFPSIATNHNGRYLVRYLELGGADYEVSTQYGFPPLEIARRQFALWLGCPVPWTNAVADWVSDPPISLNDADDAGPSPGPLRFDGV